MSATASTIGNGEPNSFVRRGPDKCVKSWWDLSVEAIIRSYRPNIIESKDAIRADFL